MTVSVVDHDTGELMQLNSDEEWSITLQAGVSVEYALTDGTFTWGTSWIDLNTWSYGQHDPCEIDISLYKIGFGVNGFRVVDMDIPEGHFLPEDHLAIQYKGSDTEHTDLPSNITVKLKKTTMGDVNADGASNVSDMVLLQKWLLTMPDTHLANWKAADLCADGKLDVFDLSLMKRAMINGEIEQPISPVTQPIGLDHIEEVIALLNHYDLNDYDEYYRDSLHKMFERFNEDGSIYHFTDAKNEITLREDDPNAAIWLLPSSNYEDIGVLYHVAYQGKYYQVYYYFTDPAYPASDLWDYLAEQRMDIQNIRVVDEKFGIVDFSNDDQFDMCAFYVIDGSHYCKVRTYESEEALMDFLQVLDYEKLDMEGNTFADPLRPVNQKIEHHYMHSAFC